MNFIRLNDIARVFIHRPAPSVEIGSPFSIVKFGDIPSSGFLLSAKDVKIVEEGLGNGLLLEAYDILVPIHHRIDNIAIIGNIEQKLLLSPPFTIIRLQRNEISIEQQAIALYMYLKSEKGQSSLSKLIEPSVRIARISLGDLRNLSVPLYSDEERIQQIEKFYQEIKLYQEIADVKNKIKMIHML